MALLIYMPVFGFLDRFPIRLWDESRLAVNAYEMLNNKNYIVTYYDGAPDMWNTKPPLLIWLQVGFMKLIGVNELSVRLPSAFAALFTFLAILIFSVRYLKSFWFGFIAVMVLVTTQGYIDLHATRTGDYDSLMTLFTTLNGLTFFLFCVSKKNSYLYLFFGTLALAVLTKSVNGLLFIPAFIIFLLIRRQTLEVLRNKHFYFGLAGFIFIAAGYYLLREYHNPGYLAAVAKNELGGRYLNTLENHYQGFWFYYNSIIRSKFSYWHLLVPCGLALGFFSKKQKLKELSIFLALMVLTFFLVISFSKTKLLWYDVPLFPFLSMIVAIFLFYFFDILRNMEVIQKTLHKNVLPVIFLFLILISPYNKIIEKTYQPQEYPWDMEFYEMSYYLKQAFQGKHNLNKQHMLYDGDNAHLKFYLLALHEKGYRTDLKNWTTLSKGDIVFTKQNHIREYVEKSYSHTILGQNGNIITYRIDDVTSDITPGIEQKQKD